MREGSKVFHSFFASFDESHPGGIEIGVYVYACVTGNCFEDGLGVLWIILEFALVKANLKRDFHNNFYFIYYSVSRYSIEVV